MAVVCAWISGLYLGVSLSEWECGSGSPDPVTVVLGVVFGLGAVGFAVGVS